MDSEYAKKFGDSLNKKGINSILFDLDDTLIETHLIFVRQIEKYLDTLSNNTKYTKKHLKKIFEESNIEVHEKILVNPIRWKFVVKNISKKLDSKYKDVVISNIKILNEIYNIVPVINEGTVEVLNLLNKTHVKLALVTHANVKWTHFKLDSLGLKKYFEHIEIADENRFKEPQDWLAALNHLGISPKNSALIGDNVKGDIISGHSVGIKHLFLLPSPWSYYANGDIPEGTIKLNSLAEFLPLLEGVV